MTKRISQAELAQAKQMLEIAFKTMKVSYIFQAGTFVRWKKGMKNKQYPDYGDPAIVVESLLTPVFDNKSGVDVENPLFREPYDLVLGLFATHDGDFLLFHYDSRRFEPLPE